MYEFGGFANLQFGGMRRMGFTGKQLLWGLGKEVSEKSSSSLTAPIPRAANAAEHLTSTVNQIAGWRALDAILLGGLIV